MNTYRNHQPATVAPWFAYCVGILLSFASIAVVYEVIRVELAVSAMKDAAGHAVENFKKSK